MMFNINDYFLTLLPLLSLATFGWLLSLKHQNVTVVDSLWAIFFLIASCTCMFLSHTGSDRSFLLLGLVTIWSLRLSIHLHLRNHNKPEDHRYQAIRLRNEPNFKYKSLYLVFILQAVLAWIISLPLFVSAQSSNPMNVLDSIGIIVWLIGMGFQVIGDNQLTQFKAKADNQGKVLNTGLWRFTRHPNYFGESCIWFGYGIMAAASGHYWTIISPIFMTYLLVKVTGAKLLESEIGKRRPEYKTYINKTNRFFPWFPKDTG